MGDHVLFFYGTLMAPQILHRVIHGRADPEPWQKALLKFKPAVLQGYKRHRVRHADYPGIVPVAVAVPANDSETPSDSAKTEQSTAVLGTLVSGLTDGDVYRLDLFEGDEYEKREVRVKVLQGQEGGDLQQALNVAETGAGVEDGEEVDAVTYVWTAGEGRLEEAEWDFETFQRDKLAWWVGADERQWQSM